MAQTLVRDGWGGDADTFLRVIGTKFFYMLLI